MWSITLRKWDGWRNSSTAFSTLAAKSRPKVRKAENLSATPVAYVKADLAIQVPGVDLLRKCMESLTDDPTTYDIMKAYLADEEEDLFWSEEQLDLVEMIGVQNWLVKQM